MEQATPPLLGAKGTTTVPPIRHTCCVDSDACGAPAAAASWLMPTICQRNSWAAWEVKRIKWNTQHCNWNSSELQQLPSCLEKQKHTCPAGCLGGDMDEGASLLPGAAPAVAAAKGATLLCAAAADPLRCEAATVVCGRPPLSPRSSYTEKQGQWSRRAQHVGRLAGR